MVSIQVCFVSPSTFDAHSSFSNGFSEWVSLYRANSTQDYSDRDSRLMQSLFPHLPEALTINRRIHLEYLGDGQRRFQLAIAHLLAQGQDYQKISQKLNISPGTVRTHIKNIYKKLQFSNKAQLIAALGEV